MNETHPGRRRDPAAETGGRDCVAGPQGRAAAPVIGPFDWSAQPYPWSEIGPAFRREVEAIVAERR